MSYTIVRPNSFMDNVMMLQEPGGQRFQLALHFCKPNW
jgi:hypothetical protein